MSISFYPTQEPGPQATDQPLPDYLSYSAYQTNVETIAVTKTGLVYGAGAPSPTVVASQEVRTQVAYSVVNLPLTYDGPLPPPPLGTGWVLPGQEASNGGGMSSTGDQDSTAATTPTQQTATATATATATESSNASTTASNSESNSSGETSSAAQSDGETATSPAASQSASQTATSDETNTNNNTNTNSASQPNENSASATSSAINSNPSGSNPAPTASNPVPTSDSSSNSSSNSNSATNSPSPSISSPSPSSIGTSSNPSSLPTTSGGVPFDPTQNEGGLSDGQIAGIVVGSVLGFLLLLLLILLCLRRRRQNEEAAAAGYAGTGRRKRQISDKWASGFSTGGTSKGNYAALGAAGAGAGAAAAAGASRSRGSLRSDEWEEDHLTGGGGSGFFVVGGKRQERNGGSSSPTGSYGRRSSRGHIYGNVGRGSPSSQNGASKKGLGSALGIGAGAGLLATALGRSRSKRDKQPPSPTQDQDPFSDDYDPDPDLDHEEPEMTERRGLMNNFGSDSPHGLEDDDYYGGGGDDSEMRNFASSSGWGGAAAVGAGLAGAGIVSAGKRSGNEERDTSGMASSHSGFNTTRPSTRESHSRSGQSHAGSGSGSGSGSATISGGGISSASTGGRTNQGSPTMGTSLPPPPRAARERQAQVLGNVAPSKEGAATLPGFQEGFGSGELGLGRVSSNTALGALAAQHRESAASTYSKGFYPSGVPSGYESSSDQLTEEDRATGNRPRHSQFLSANTNLLGPEAHDPGPTDSETDEATPLGGSHSRDRSQAQVYGHLGPPSAAYAQHGRLSTIRSVGEFGERSQSSEAFSGSNSGSGSVSINQTPRGTMGEPRSAKSFASSGASRRGGSRMGISSTFSPERDGDDLSQSEGDTGDSIRTSEEVQEIPDDESENHQDEGNAGFFGGMAAGWHRLTLNPSAWLTGGNNNSSSSEAQPLASTQEEIGQDDAAIEQVQTARHEASAPIDSGVAPDARSEHATIYRASTLGHGGSGGQNSPAAINSSREGSGGSANEGLLPAAGARNSPAPRSIGESRSSSSQRGDGYIASVSGSGSMSRRSASSASVMTGLDSLSQHPQASSSGASGSLSSGSRRSQGTGRGASESGASTGAASYSPSYPSRGSGRLRGSASGSGSGSGSFASSSRAAYAAGRQRSAFGDADYAEWDSDAHTSNATDGSLLDSSRPASSSNKKKRPRSNSAEGVGPRRLSSVADLQEDQDEEEAQVLRTLPRGQGHFPSPSLGAAMLRQANRDAASASGSGHARASSGSNPTTPRALPKSLLPGPVPPLPPTLHTSTSSPSLSEPNAIHSQEGSGSWRQSPRVASASQRASAAAAHLEASRATALSPSKSGSLPRSDPKSRSTSEEFAWGELGGGSPPASPRTRSRLRNLHREAEQGEAGLQEDTREEEEQQGGGLFTEWPKFLRF